MSIRIGYGFDTHRFSDDPQRKLMLGGVVVDNCAGLIGHSDADCIAHAITDALLGAAMLGDMGQHFPDTDSKWKGADSLVMLRAAVDLVMGEGFRVGNVDTTVVCEKPKIAPHREVMQKRLSTVVGAPVSVKASRAEGMGALGRVEGIACWAVALLVEAPEEGRS
jgi:2-C-methyl-D-erythritol 2,4-cyclodiphosphate synthase